LRDALQQTFQPAISPDHDGVVAMAHSPGAPQISILVPGNTTIPQCRPTVSTPHPPLNPSPPARQGLALGSPRRDFALAAPLPRQRRISKTEFVMGGPFANHAAVNIYRSNKQ
jgi:hypothetical protein